MIIVPFATEHFYAKYEFSTPYQLCNSDCEDLSVAELLAMSGSSLEELGRLPLGYTESQGNPRLREAIACIYAQVKPEEVIGLATPVEGIYLVANAVLNPGDEVIALCPAYDALLNTFEHVVGVGNVKLWRFKPTANQWELDLDELDALITPRTKMLVVNFPHNPTGYLPGRDQFEKIINTVNKYGLTLFCDEMYSGLVLPGTEPIPSAADLCDRAIVLSGLSKSYGLPGLRSGWLVVKNKALRDAIINWKFYTSICSPAPSEFLAEAALKVRGRLIARSLEQIVQNLDLAESFFARWPGLFSWRPPLSGSIALVGMNVNSVEDYAERLARDAGVLIQPATTLRWDNHHFRLGLGRAGFGVALKKFEEHLRAHAPMSG